VPSGISWSVEEEEDLVDDGGAELPIRVLVAEPHEPSRQQRICEAVRLDPRLELLGCAPDAASSVARALALAPDVLVLDSDLPHGALAAALEIRSRLPATQLVVTHKTLEDDFLAALAVGASAYVSHADDTERLLQAIADVSAGEIVLSGAQVARLVEAVRDPARPRRTVVGGPALTAREWQILALLRERRTMPEIAEHLFLSPVTIRSHARSIRRKLAAAGRGADEGRSPIYR
jgi:DNA-binding NarL/FixJ family response regulator